MQRLKRGGSELSNVGTPAPVAGPVEPVEITVALDTGKPLTAALIRDVEQACDRAEEAGGRPAVLVRLSGGHPAAGWPGDVGIHVVNKWERALRRLERLPAATVCLIEGPVAGPALEIMLATDYRIATPDAELALPAGSGEIWPGMALYRLANQLGAAAARRLVLFGSVLTAEQARAEQLIDEVGADPAARAATVIARLHAAPGSELAIRRRLLLDATTTSFEESLGVHLAACDRAMLRARTAGSR